MAQLDGFGCGDMPRAIAAAGALVDYVEATQHAALAHIASMRTYAITDTLILDAATRRNLEIERSATGDARHSVVGLLDRCATSMGARALRRWLAEPTRDFNTLRHRHQAIETLAGGAYEPIADKLRSMVDVERIATRIALGSARPRDLSGLAAALAGLPGIKTELATIELALENYKAKNDNYPHSHPWSWDKPNGYMYPPNNWTNVFPITNHLGGNQLYKYLVADADKNPHLPNVKESQYEGESLLAPVTDVRSGSPAKWYYNSNDPRYNKNSYDLWVEYGDLGKDINNPSDDTVKIISNWNK